MSERASERESKRASGRACAGTGARTHTLKHACNTHGQVPALKTSLEEEEEVEDRALNLFSAWKARKTGILPEDDYLKESGGDTEEEGRGGGEVAGLIGRAGRGGWEVVKKEEEEAWGVGSEVDEGVVLLAKV